MSGGSDRRAGADVRREKGREEQARRKRATTDEKVARLANAPTDPEAERDEDD